MTRRQLHSNQASVVQNSLSTYTTGKRHVHGRVLPIVSDLDSRAFRTVLILAIPVVVRRSSPCNRCTVNHGWDMHVCMASALLSTTAAEACRSMYHCLPIHVLAQMPTAIHLSRTISFRHCSTEAESSLQELDYQTSLRQAILQATTTQTSDMHTSKMLKPFIHDMRCWNVSFALASGCHRCRSCCAAVMYTCALV